MAQAKFKRQWLKGFGIAVLALLAGCSASQDYKKVAWQQQDPSCQTERCTRIEVNYPLYNDSNELNHLIQYTLIEMANWRQDSTEHVSNNLKEYATRFFEAAKSVPDDLFWQAIISAAPLYEYQHILTLQLDTYLYTGGAHGLPSTRFLLWDTENHRALRLNDLLLPNQYQALMEKIDTAYRAWLSDQDSLTPSYLEAWPFEPTDNVALSPEGLVVKYNAYAIAPYVNGEPTFVIPYSQLQNILQKQYLPDA